MKNLGAIALAVLVGYVVVRVVFGFAGGLIGLLLALAWFALKLLLFVGVAYWVLSVLAPDTARKIRDRVQGSPGAM
jgi:hypothetical protein